MINVETDLLVADNSGAKRVRCIKVLGGSKKRSARVSEVIKISIKEAIPGGKVKKGEVYEAVIVRCRYPVSRKNGESLRFNDNAVVILNKQGAPVGTRVFGAVSRELRYAYPKIVSLASVVV